jgi:DNA-binding winged helix-turn-helix (wHTH) protein
MANTLRIGLLGPLQVRDEAGRLVHVGGRQLRVLLTLLALDAGRVVPAASLADQLWPDRPPGNPGNALQTLVSRLRAELRQAGFDDVIESHPAGYRLAVRPDAIDAILTATENVEPAGSALRYRILETVRAYGLERLAEAGEQERLRDAFAAYYLNLAETTDPRLRASGQGRWLRELTAEQDNMHAAVRSAITAGDADTALRFVLALAWYWMIRGQPGESQTLARETLALEPSERSPRIAEARVVCALTAAGQSW